MRFFLHKNSSSITLFSVGLADQQLGIYGLGNTVIARYYEMQSKLRKIGSLLICEVNQCAGTRQPQQTYTSLIPFVIGKTKPNHHPYQ